MKAKIILKSHELKEVQSILHRHLSTDRKKVWVFGSRANGTPRENSDLDLLFDPPLSLQLRGNLNEDFENSILPFEVDLVNLSDLAIEYKNQVESAKIPLSF